MKAINVKRLGLTPYREAQYIQKKLVEKRIKGKINDTLLLLEHPPVITEGAKNSNDDYKSSKRDIKRNGIDIVKTKRGGRLTYHAPGQLIAYPIIKYNKRDIASFIHKLEGTIINVLSNFNMADIKRDKKAGVRIQGKKIGWVGVRFKKWVSQHGVALNINLDLKPYKHIVPCGVDNEDVTSIRNEITNKINDKDNIYNNFIDTFCSQFNYKRYKNNSDSIMPDPTSVLKRPKRKQNDTVSTKPYWLKTTTPNQEQKETVNSLIESKKLNTVCEEASCPNIGECWSRGTATFMLLGDTCTRSCGFCDVKTGTDLSVDTMEPFRVAKSVKQMDLNYVVLTSVNRDDLDDGGASVWAQTIEAINYLCPQTKVECLVPDFEGVFSDIDTVLNAGPDIFNHNIETVPRLYQSVRPQADYQQSLNVLQYANNQGYKTKSGFMLGLGEWSKEVKNVLNDLKDNDVSLITIGQYLRPSDEHLPIQRFAHPVEFNHYKQYGEKIGFTHVESGPLVRSSYKADKQHKKALK